MGHWGGVWDMVGAGDEDTTTMSMVSFWCLCCLPWTCFTLSCAVSVFGFRDVGVWGYYLLQIHILHFYSSSGVG